MGVVSEVRVLANGIDTGKYKFSSENLKGIREARRVSPDTLGLGHTRMKTQEY